MTSNTLIVFFAVIIELLIFVTLIDLVWRIISIRRSCIPLPLQREINKTIVCPYPDSLWIYLKLIFFNPKDMHFRTLFAFIGVLGGSTIHVAIGLIALLITLFICIFKLVRLSWQFNCSKEKFPAIKLSDKGVSLIYEWIRPAEIVYETPWQNITQVFLYRSYAKIISKDHTYYTFYNTSDMEVKNKIAMHFLRHDDIKAITIAEQDKISWILLIVCLLFGPPVGILCMLLFYKSKPRSAHIYLSASFVFLVIALVIYLLNTLI